MPFEAGSIEASFSINDRNSFRDMESKALGLKGAFEEAANSGENSFKKMFEGIRAQAGRRSLFGESFELLAGGGIIGGLGIAAEQVNKFSESIAQMADKLRSGQMSQQQALEEGVRSIPVFGSMVTAVDNIRESLTGEDAAFAQFSRGLDVLTSKVDANIASLHKYRDELNGISTLSRKWKDDLIALHHPDLAPGMDFADRQKQLLSTSPHYAGFLSKSHGDIAGANDDIFKQLQVNDGSLYDAMVQAENFKKALDAADKSAQELKRDGASEGEIEAKTGLSNKEDAYTTATARAASLRSEINLLHEAQKEAAAYADALSSSKQKLGNDLSREGLSEFAKTVEYLKSQKSLFVHAFNGLSDAASRNDKDLQAQAWDIFEQTRTSQEKYDEQVERLKALKNDGLLPGDTFNRAMKQYQSELQGPLQNTGVHAQELFGTPRDATSADLPPQAQQAMQSQIDTARNTEGIVPALEKIADKMSDNVLSIFTGL